MHSFIIFCKNLTKHGLHLCAFGRQTKIIGKFWENFENFRWKIYRKITFLFYFYFGKFANKNIAFGNNTLFLQQFFRFLGEGEFPLPPGYALGLYERIPIKISNLPSAKFVHVEHDDSDLYHHHHSTIKIKKLIINWFYSYITATLTYNREDIF